MSSSFPSLSAQGNRAFPLPSIPEDTLHYTLHLSPSQEENESALAVLISDHVQSLLVQPWLWNKDGWELKAVDSADGSGPANGVKRGGKLEGRMRVGDAVDDEWLVVWLLREVSRRWPELVISIRDTDGEFLLIEAANELPNWVSPENAENRVWLQGGHLHLVPLSIRSSTTGLPRRIPDEDEEERRFDPEAYISEEDGVAAVRTGKYRAEVGMENAVWDRIACYPEAMKTHRHRTKAWIPEPIAKALAVHPELIQKAVEGFYVRDPAQLRAASRMTHFPPSPAVLSSVLMTRAAYAQLQGQVFHPPRVFGPEWHVKEGAELDGERRWRDLGVKIATGFEIMYREGGKKGRSGQTTAGSDENRGGVDYETFIANLSRAGFFQGELEGSEKWRKREEEAERGWKEVRTADVTAQRPSFAYQVDQALSSSSATAQMLQVSEDEPEDSDSWLEVSPDELDRMMQRASGQTAGNGGGDQVDVDMANEDGKALGDLAKKVEEFVGGSGDMQGARFIDELSDDDNDDDDDDDDDIFKQGNAGEDGEEDEDSDMEIEQTSWDKLDPEDKEERMRNLVAPLDAAEWGRKDADTEVITIGKPASAPAPSKAPPAAATKAVGSKAKDFASDSAPKMRPPIFEKQQFDGVESDSDDEMAETDLPPPGTLGRRIAEMKWGEMGPSIEEIDDDGDDLAADGGVAGAGQGGDDEERNEASFQAARKKKLSLGDDIDEQMRRRVWGDEDAAEVGEDAPMVVGMDGVARHNDGGDAEEGDGDDGVDFGAEEEEFLKFTREALGIDEAMWEKIVESRKERGAFVPTPGSKSTPSATAQAGLRSAQHLPPGSAQKSTPVPTTSIASEVPQATKTKTKTAASSAPAPAPAPAAAATSDGKPNPALDSFESVMAAMDAELARVKGPTAPAPSSTDKKVAFAPLPNLPLEEDLDDLDEDTLAAMDRELKAALKNAGVEDSDEEEDDDDGEGGAGVGQLDEDGKREYEMMRNFLESYRSQGGESGAVGNLFGRLGGNSRK